MIRYRLVIPILAVTVGACKARTDAAVSSAPIDTVSTHSTAGPATPVSADQEAAISGGQYDPIDPDGGGANPSSRFAIGVDLFASGRLVLALDTLWPRVQTEDTNRTRTVTDSLVVTGISSKENWTYNCTKAGQYEPFVVAVIPMEASAPTVPRLAWKFDTVTYRIRPIPANSISCAELSD